MIKNISRPEQCLIGSVMRDSNLYDEIANKISAEDFECEMLGELFKIISSLVNESKSVSLISVSEVFEQNTGVDEFVRIADIARNTYGDKSILHYAKLIHQNSTEKKLISAAESIIHTTRTETDIDEIIQSSQQEILEITEGRTKSSFRSISELAKDYVERMQDRVNRDSKLIGLSTGYDDLDSRTGGLCPGDLIIVAARPSMGKTTLAVNIAENIMSDGRVLIFSLEMSADQLVDRVVSSRARINITRLRTGDLSEDEWMRHTPAVSKIIASNIIIDDTPGISINYARTVARQVKRKGDIDLIVVDYLQLMHGKGENRTNQITQISGGLKALAKENNCPVIAISQLNRSLEQRADKRPILSDLRESGAIEQDADIIAFIYRDDYYNKDSELKGLAEINIAKHRNGETGSETLLFRGDLCRFDDYNGESIDFSKKEENSDFEYSKF